MNTNIEEEILPTVLRMLAKQSNEDDPPPTAPGQAMIAPEIYDELELSFGYQ